MTQQGILKGVTFAGGLYFFLFFLLPEPVLDSLGINQRHASISKGFIVIGAMAFGIGVLHLFMMHVKKIARKDSNSIYSLILLVAMVATLIFGVIDWRQDDQNVLTLSKIAVRVLHEGFFIPLGSSMFALLAFYIASASFRAFRIKSWETALLMISAVIVILGQTPFAVLLSEKIPLLRNWLLTVPSTATFRGISIGASIASLILSMRVWLSLDRQDSKVS